MAFSSIVVEPGAKQFQGLFKEMWTVSALNNFASLSAAAEAEESIAVPGLLLGDVVIGWSMDASATDDIRWTIHVKNTDVLRVGITNVGTGAVDIGVATFKFLIGRPSW
jgi:hypothetical protein